MNNFLEIQQNDDIDEHLRTKLDILVTTLLFELSLGDSKLEEQLITTAAGDEGASAVWSGVSYS